MSELKRNHMKFISVIVLNVLFFILCVLIFVYVGRWLQTVNYNLVWTLAFVLLLILTYSTFRFRASIWTVVNEKYRLQLGKNLGDPLPIKRMRTKESIARYLLNNEYELFTQDETHQTFYKVEKNKIRKMFGGYVLKVVVYVSKNQEEFYLQAVDEDINRIQDKLYEERKRVQNFLITQLKPVDDINDEVKKQIKETLFFKTQRSVVSTVNVALHHESEKAVLFYSNTYSPSLYYTEQIEDIKKMV